MKEHEIKEKLFASAQSLKVPEALAPEQIKEILKNNQKQRRLRMKKITAAACLCLCVLGAGSAAYIGGRAQKQMDAAMQEQNTGADAEQPQNVFVIEDAAAEEGVDDSVEVQEKPEPLKKIGRMYTLASDYGDVYEVLEESGAVRDRYRIMNDLVKKESAFTYSTGAQSLPDDVKNSPVEQSAAADVEDSASVFAVDSSTDYSTTNLQVEGVDESDIVKTDGKFIYVAQKDGIQILDIRNGRPKKAAFLEPNMDSESDIICEMFVADNMLTLIIQTEDISLQEQAVQSEVGTYVTEDGTKTVEDGMPAEGGMYAAPMERTDDAAVINTYELNTNIITKISTYDISNPEKPVFKDSMTQDGWYDTARKIGSRLYLFTNETLWLTDTARTQLDDGTTKGVIPCVDGTAIAADCIYLQKRGNEGLLMSSVSLEDGCEVLDSKLLVHTYANLYVTEHSVYVYYSDYTQSGEKTRLARFMLEDDGSISARAAVSLRGDITDTFAINEKDNYLWVLTSDTGTETWENFVYVLDENLKTAGKLTGLAKGERIYAARFIGDTGYFVTYRNTDPLFTVDFSNPKKPNITGELKVTGFSEYLHFWGEDKLLGVGYESNPENGAVTGVKISMFDISNPAEAAEESRFVLEDADDCPYDYKAILVNREKNIIAFATRSYDSSGMHTNYHVFSYKDKNFVKELNVALDNEKQIDYMRSLYAGDILYLADAEETAAFDMKHGWEEIGKAEY